MNAKHVLKKLLCSFIAFVGHYDKFVVAISTVVIAFFTLALFIATFLLWFSDKEHSERSLRAYVFAKPLLVTNFSAGANAEVSVSTRNAGQTPAYHVRVASVAVPLPFPLPKDIPTGYDSSEDLGEVVINPGTENDVGIKRKTDIALSEPDASAIKEGKNSRLYIYGTIIYKDAFDKPHYTNYCFTFYGNGPILTAWDYCTQHNDAD